MDGAPRNSVSLIDRYGKILLTYAKVHTCEFDWEAALTPGDSFSVCALDTEQGDVKIGFMICYDREFPESARILMLQGAELILTPNSCRLEDHRMSQFKTRAYENMIGVGMTNYAAPQNNGHSAAFDAVAFDAGAYPGEDGEPRDTLIIEAGEMEDVYMAPFDLDSIRSYREREAWAMHTADRAFTGCSPPRKCSHPLSAEMQQGNTKCNRTTRCRSAAIARLLT